MCRIFWITLTNHAHFKMEYRESIKTWTLAQFIEFNQNTKNQSHMTEHIFGYLYDACKYNNHNIAEYIIKFYTFRWIFTAKQYRRNKYNPRYSDYVTTKDILFLAIKNKINCVSTDILNSKNMCYKHWYVELIFHAAKFDLNAELFAKILGIAQNILDDLPQPQPDADSDDDNNSETEYDGISDDDTLTEADSENEDECYEEYEEQNGSFRDWVDYRIAKFRHELEYCDDDIYIIDILLNRLPITQNASACILSFIKFIKANPREFAYLKNQTSKGLHVMNSAFKTLCRHDITDQSAIELLNSPFVNFAIFGSNPPETPIYLAIENPNKSMRAVIAHIIATRRMYPTDFAELLQSSDYCDLILDFAESAQNQECAVCWESAMLWKLPMCSHKLCHKCTESIKKTAPLCPLCRASF